MLQAADAKRNNGATAAIGFTAATDIDRTSPFWGEVASRGGPAFGDAVDFAGLNIYPDVFGPSVPPDELAATTAGLVRDYRGRSLTAAGVPATVPIRICESGWPTGPDRSEQDQARALETIVRTVAGLRDEVGVTHWELFTLRDADSSRDDIFHRFGVLRDDYSRKPAVRCPAQSHR